MSDGTTYELTRIRLSVHIAGREELADDPPGDLLQAGPYSNQDQPAPESRPVVRALVFTAR